MDSGTSDANIAKYNAAYSDAPTVIGCKLVDHVSNTATDETPVGISYEPYKDLAFDTDNDGVTYTVSAAGVVSGDSGDACYNGGKGWTPIATSANPFTAAFDGTGLMDDASIAWRWQRCDDAAMTTNCKLCAIQRAQRCPTEYTPAAGTNTDVGKYLRAYAYYAGSSNSSAWTRTQTPVLGPVVAAPAPTTTP